MADDGVWRPLTVREVAALFARAGFPWWIAGGWAIDLFVGRQTRAHGDIEIAVLRRDHRAARAVLAGWDLHVAEGRLTPWAGDGALPTEAHNVWCRPAPESPWALQVLIEEAEGDEWIYRRDGRIRRPLSALGRTGADGVPYIAPEIQLLYKAKAPRDRDAADLAAALPLLEPGPAGWLAAALETTGERHPWLAELRRANGGRAAPRPPLARE